MRPMIDTCTVQAICVECGDAVQTTVDCVPLGKFLLREQTVQVLFYDQSQAERDVISGFRSGSYLCGDCWRVFTAEGEEV